MTEHKPLTKEDIELGEARMAVMENSPLKSEGFVVELIRKLREDNAKLVKALKRIANHGCYGPAAYDALSCKGYVQKADWCGACIAKEASDE